MSASDKESSSLDLVIASKNRERDVTRCLESVKKQATLPDNIIVIDQTQTPYRLKPFDTLLHIHAPQLSGLTAARNLAIQYIRSEFVLFLDDDMELLSDCVSALKLDFVRRPDAVALVCLLTPLTGLTPLGRIREAIFEHGFFNRAPIRRSDGFELRTLNGGGMCLRASLLSNEKFDEVLTGYSFGEDFEFAQRAKKYGRLWRCPAARVAHHISPANRLAVQTVRRDAWFNYLYFYNKLDAGAVGWNRLYLWLWAFEQSLLWLRAGMGLPPIAQSLSKNSTAREQGPSNSPH